jgi:xylulokinase
MPLVAGVDSSTQSCKIAIRDLETGALIRQGRASHLGGTEVDPEHWWEALQAAIADAGGLNDVVAISISGQQHGMVVLDLNGQVIRPALLWNDTRSAGAAADLIAEFGAEELARRTGSVPVASFTSTKLRWLRDTEPEHAVRVAAVALPHDWLTWRFLGYGPKRASRLGPVLAALTTDRSDASGTGYWDRVTGKYDTELFVKALGHDAIRPVVLAPQEQAGCTPAGLIVAAGCGDNAGAALGLAATSGDVVVSIGTSGTVFAVTHAPSEDATGTVAGFADASGLSLPLVATLNAARVMGSVAELLGVDNRCAGELALMAEPGAGGVVLLPYFAGERTPNLPNSSASVHGLTIASATRPNLARAAIEGMLCGLAAGLDALRAVGVRENRVLLTGGAAQNLAVQAIAAQVFDASVIVPKPGEYVAAGAAVQAAWAFTGTRPDWPVELVAAPKRDHRPLIRAQYARYAG